MLEWLKKLGGRKPWKNRAGLDAKSIELLEEDFGSLEKLNENLPADVLRYILDEEGADVLTRLAGTDDTCVELHLVNYWRGAKERSETARARFFEGVRCNAPGLFIRLGRTFEAAARSRQSQGKHQVASWRPQRPFNDPRLDWLEILLVEATLMNLNAWPRSCRACPALNAELLEAMLKMETFPPDTLVRAAFLPQLQRFGNAPFEPVFQSLNGFAESAVRHKHVVLEALNHSDFKQRAYALGMMLTCKVAAEPFVEKLVDLALGSAKASRQQSRLLLADVKSAAKPLIERKFLAGGVGERVMAAGLLWEWEGENIRPLLEKCFAEEKSKKVLQAIQFLLAASKPKTEAAAGDDVQALPELPPVSSHAPLSVETGRAWRECFDKINLALTAMNNVKATRHFQPPKPISPDVVNQAFAFLQNGGEDKAILVDLFHAGWNKELNEPLSSFWQQPELKPVHLVRFLILVGGLKSNREHHKGFLSYGHWLETLLPVYRRVHPETGLRELGAAFAAAGLDARRIGSGLLGRSFGERITRGMPKELVWPYWAENLELLEQAFAPKAMDFMQRYEQRQARENAFAALAFFPTPPRQLLELLWAIALGPKSERPQAQRCLDDVSDKLERLTAALSNGSAETRFAAAEWLGRLGDKAAITPLKVALKKEKNETAKGEIMGALERLGVPVEQFLDRDGLLKESEKCLAKGIPEDLKWFPLEQLPAVHWVEDGKPVERAIIRWWVVQGFKLKNPEPGPLLRKYCASLKPVEREALGQFVLQAWLAKDTSPRLGAEAEKEAMRRANAAVAAAQQWAQWVKQNPQMAQQMAAYAPKQKTLQEHYEDILPIVQREPTGTAISSKGVLSLAGACVGSGAAPLIGRYLKDWYGMRAAQCRALLQMLAWVEHKTATQLLLAVGSRFRTKSIQEEANKQSQALADRKGWTIAELADRTIPAAGLDDDGVLTLDFGPRQFTAKLNEDLEFTLADGEGKSLKTLPDPRVDDDQTKAAEAKKVFSAARKELKSVITMQRERFYEAMCTQRTWSFEDWSAYLNHHPIARHHCQRLVWAVVLNGKVASLFRPLADGTLTDASDDPLVPQSADFVRLAHECQITPEQSQAWRAHFKDYEVEPLFEQFGRPNFTLLEERQNETTITDFQGHLLEAFKLRGRASKLGYTRGQAQDGGWFFDYHKRFPTLGLEAVIEFTGNGLPEENRTVALTSLQFVRVADEGEAAGGNAKMTLSEVPAVLLSECWNDIRAIAAEGSGFDPEWEKKAHP